MKKFIALLLSSAMLLSLTYSLTAFAEANTEYPEHLDLIWMGYTGNEGDPIPEDDRIKSILEEKFNVTITKAQVDWANREEMVLYFASGNTVDVMMSRQLERDTLVEEGLIRSIPEDLLYKYMPDWMNHVTTMVGEEVVKQQMYYNGEIWGVPYTAESRVSPYVYLINKTWLEASGATEVPKTMDELHDFLTYCTFNDPDGDGENNTYGIGSTGNGSFFGFSVVFAAYGAFPKAYNNRDGQIVAGCQTEEYKEALKLLAQWYSEGIIEPEFATWQGYTPYYEECVLKAKDGLMSMPVIYYYESRLNTFAEFFPQYNVDIFYGVEDNEGVVRTAMQYPSLYTGQYPYYFGCDTTDEQMIRGMQILNAFCTDEELALMTNFGEVEEHGANWYLDDTGVYKRNDQWYTENERTALDIAKDARSFYCVLPSNIAPIKTLSSRVLDATAFAVNQEKTYMDRDFAYMGTNSAYSTYSGDLSTIEDAFILNVILGRKTVDNDYDAFIKEWESAGGLKVVDEYQKLYEETLK